MYARKTKGIILMYTLLQSNSNESRVYKNYDFKHKK